MENTKQDIYNNFMTHLGMERIALLKHDFELGEQFTPGANIGLNVDSKQLFSGFIDDKLVINNRYVLEAKQNDKIIWKGEYIYQVVFSTDKAKYDEMFKDAELKKLFEINQITLFLWPYVRQEVQYDTQKAGLPPVVLPPRI